MFPARGGSWPSAQPGSRRAPSGLLPRAQIPSRPLGPLTFLHVIVAENHGGRRGLQQRPRKRKEKRKRGSASARLTPLLSLREGCHKMRGPLGATGGGRWPHNRPHFDTKLSLGRETQRVPASEASCPPAALSRSHGGKGGAAAEPAGKRAEALGPSKGWQPHRRPLPGYPLT